MKKQVLLFIAAFLIAIPAFSQDSIKIFKDTITIKEVVITGTPVKVNKNNVPMAVSVVTRQQISESNESALLPVLSGLVPGLFVTERGITGFGVSNGAAGQITIRGYWALMVENDFEKYSGNAKVFYNFGTHKISDGFHSNDNNYGLNISESAKVFHGNSITIGCDYTNYGGKATQDIGGGNAMTLVDTTVYEVGLYGFVQHRIFRTTRS